MHESSEVVAALEDLIIGYADEVGPVAHIAFRAKITIEGLMTEIEEQEGTIKRLTSLMKQAGIEVLP